MKKPLVLLALLLQVAALAWMAINREWILANGQTVFLRTAPIDPRDIFRGDFVRLNYEISTLSSNELDADLLSARESRRHKKVFVPLILNERGLASPLKATGVQPESGLYLRGRVQYDWHLGKENRRHIQLKYGIEQYFTEQGKGLEMEKRRGARTGIQVPLEMELAVSDTGTAVIRGHRWSPLGMGLSVVQPVPTGNNIPADQRSAVLQLVLKNVSQAPLRLLMLPEFCSFTLTSTKQSVEDLTLNRPECADITPGPEHIVVLAPEEELSREFDFNQPHWQVMHNGKKVAIGTLDWGQRFRLVYQSPLPSDTDPSRFWTDRLPSRAFHGRGQID
jgi:uncharacterized membrane-anchored protein